MCGIHGLVVGLDCDVSSRAVQSVVAMQFRLSDSRGKEAAGWALRAARRITVHHRPLSGRRLVQTRRHRELLSSTLDEVKSNGRLRPPLAIIGHSRLVTHGSEAASLNNQPVAREGIVVVHNGIVVNHTSLWKLLPGDGPQSELDTEVLAPLLARYRREGGSIVSAARDVFADLEGSASLAVLFDDAPKLLLATNTGSLYLAGDERRGVVFASEREILKKLLRSRAVRRLAGPGPIVHLPSGIGYMVDLETCRLERFSLQNGHSPAVVRHVERPAPASPPKPAAEITLITPQRDIQPRIDALRRCTRCVLPETFPFLEFDEQGVCNYCRNHTPMHVKGLDMLRDMVGPYRRGDGNVDCVVAFSGGRDSSYGLHIIKHELGLNPIAFTYDWGMVTDLARRNQARVCGKLGIEHILISADIRRKRANIHRNVKAWLKKPDLGMVPLFMAGDKQFFYYANKLRKQAGVKLMIFAVNPMEQTGFKSGFCGVDEAGVTMYFKFPLMKRLKLSGYYLRQYLRNPSYFNRSMFDTAWAYFSAFMIPHDYVMLYDYVRWDEKIIDRTLADEYDWEKATDTTSTWRIGDGTAAFYNYIYHTVTGFSEHDTFRSNQIREGTIGRDEALRLVRQENQPRWESLKWYSEVIGFDLDEAIATINNIPRLYDRPDMTESS